jgi:hypothetical protein
MNYVMMMTMMMMRMNLNEMILVWIFVVLVHLYAMNDQHYDDGHLQIKKYILIKIL